MTEAEMDHTGLSETFSMLMRQVNSKLNLLTSRPNLHIHLDAPCPPERSTEEHRHWLP